MIVRLRGTLLEAGEGRMVVDCGGVGYEAHVPESVLSQSPGLGETVDLFVRQIVREDDISLYGFLNHASRRLFDQLREVKGCGAKTSLSVLGTLGEGPAAAAIAAQDARKLTAAPGVGPRLAERIILELKDKVADPGHQAKAAPAAKAPPKDELVEALMALGYRRGEAEAAGDEARKESGDLDAQIRAALRRLQK
jgi:Holliday junction DNA helicase RuvA